MPMKRIIYCITFICATAMMLTGCKGNGRHGVGDTLQETASERITVVHDTIFLPAADTSAALEPTPAPAPKPATPKTTAAPKKETTTAKDPIPKSGTIYVHTYGANGEVYGHVTMKGNTGSGIIHDPIENNINITVTRHGNELFGTDINGRQYVFKF